MCLEENEQDAHSRIRSRWRKLAEKQLSANIELVPRIPQLDIAVLWRSICQ